MLSRMTEEPRVIITISTRWEDGETFKLTLEAPRGSWRLSDLHELARHIALAASIASETTTLMDVSVYWPDTAGPRIED